MLLSKVRLSQHPLIAAAAIKNLLHPKSTDSTKELLVLGGWKAPPKGPSHGFK